MYLQCSVLDAFLLCKTDSRPVLTLTPCVSHTANPYPDVRRRYWNAYMLFYQRISDQNSPVLPKKSRVSVMRQEAEDLSL